MSEGTRQSTFRPYAMRFEPQLQTRVWGGRSLANLGKSLPSEQRYGESWEVSDVEGKSSRVVDGAYEGWSLTRLLEFFPSQLLGHPIGAFPLLFKLLDAQENLSVQVHPADEDLERTGATRANPLLRGKTEAWIILDAQPGAEVLHGLAPGVERADVVRRLQELDGRALSDEEVRRLFRWVEVKPGDVVFVPAGTIHALGEGIVLLEVQQTSDITYRLYDWGRLGLDGKPRRLHLAESLEVVEPGTIRCPWTRFGEPVEEPGIRSLVDSDKFHVELVELTAGRVVETTTTVGNDHEFHILAGLDDVTEYRSADGADALSLNRGEFALLPAVLGGYSLASRGDTGRCLRVSCPKGSL
jgi:mannose-6-phosphate isomerase